jgi:hypothetical protein
VGTAGTGNTQRPQSDDRLGAGASDLPSAVGLLMKTRDVVSRTGKGVSLVDLDVNEHGNDVDNNDHQVNHSDINVNYDVHDVHNAGIDVNIIGLNVKH